MNRPAWSTTDRRRIEIQPRPETVAALAELAEVDSIVELRSTKGYHAPHREARKR